MSKLALHHATGSGRGGVEPADLLLAVFEDTLGATVRSSASLRRGMAHRRRGYLAKVEHALGAAGKTIRIEDDALDLLVTQGYSLAYGARFLKRLIDERVKCPISVRWHESTLFHVRTRHGEVVVETPTAGLIAA